MAIGSNQARSGGYICHQIRPHAICNLPKLLVIDEPRIQRRPSHDELWPKLGRSSRQRRVIDGARGLVCKIRQRFKVDRGDRGALAGYHQAMGEVASMKQVQAHDSIMRMKQGSEDTKVGRCSRVRLLQKSVGSNTRVRFISSAFCV